MKIEDIVMMKNDAAEPKAYMFDHTVKVTSYVHHLRASQDQCDGWEIPYSRAVAPGENGKGRLLWKVHGLKLILR